MKMILKILYLVVGVLAVGYFALAPNAQAVVPAPDGGYPGFNTAEGQNALKSLTTGSRTRPSAGTRCSATPTAATTPLSARGPCYSTSETKTPPLARRRS
jgi:hypothetical protein